MFTCLLSLLHGSDSVLRLISEMNKELLRLCQIVRIRVIIGVRTEIPSSTLGARSQKVFNQQEKYKQLSAVGLCTQHGPCLLRRDNKAELFCDMTSIKLPRTETT
jgi:hypothetical protein